MMATSGPLDLIEKNHLVVYMYAWNTVSLLLLLVFNILFKTCTVEPRYNEDLGTIKITLL